VEWTKEIKTLAQNSGGRGRGIQGIDRTIIISCSGQRGRFAALFAVQARAAKTQSGA